MAGTPVTPQRVREILSSFLYKSDKATPDTPTEKTSQQTGVTSPEKTAGSAGASPKYKASPETLSVRRSYSSFQKRVETFSPMTWFAKPAELSPLVCARFGWVNSEYDMLHCPACQANLCGRLPSKSDTKAYKEACTELEEKLVSSHEKFCALAVNPCPESYLKVCLEEPEELRKDFLQRLDALKQRTQQYPQLDYSKLETWGFSEGHAAKFREQEKLSETDTPTQVVTLAFTGWSLSEGNAEIIMCSMCRRKVGLWNYCTNAGHTVNSDGQNGHAELSGDGSGDQGPPSKLRKIDPQEKLDPVSSHHLWCPWNTLRKPSEDTVSISFTMGTSPQSSTSPDSTSSQGEDAASPSEGAVSPGDGGDTGERKVPAWVMVARIVAPGLLSQSRRLVQQVKQSTMTDGLRCIRKVLSTWSSPEKGRKCTTSP